MGNPMAQLLHCTAPWLPPWKSNTPFFFFFFSSSSKTLPRTSSAPPIAACSSSSSHHSRLLSPGETVNPTNHTTLLVESYHRHQLLSDLLRRLRRSGSCPLQLLEEEGDWNRDHFWAVVRFLHHSSRLHEILPVFNAWKNIERSRISESNYERIICLLCREGLVDEAIQSLHQMKEHGLSLSLEIYNAIIHGFADHGKFEDAGFYMNQMKENGMLPVSETYDGLIEAYGKYKMYDELVMCLKRMESDGCSPDHVTYNLLIREFSEGGLLKRMERTYQSLMSRRMTLEPCTLVAMLEAYAEFGILEKMEETYRRILRFGISLDEELIRKLAYVYIDNLMFSRLEDLGHGVSSRTCRTDLAWCLRLLCHACLVSRKGLDSVIKEMKETKVPWTTTIANIFLLAYSKMEDLKSIKLLLSEVRNQHVKPDLITVGIMLDLSKVGFDGTGVFMTWKRLGFLDRPAEMSTDPLVLAAFGKGQFLRSCEEVYHTLDPGTQESKSWTYQYLMDLVVKHQKMRPL